MNGSTSSRRRRIGRFLVPIGAMLIIASACGKSETPSGGTSPTGGGSAVTKDAAIAAEVPADIAAKGTLTVASDASYPPMEFFDTDNTTLIGADVDLGEAIGKVLGLTFKFENATFDGIVPGLQSGKYDIGMSSFFDNADREAIVDMVNYFQAGSGIFVNSSDSQSYTSLDQFCGKSLAAESGTTQLDDIKAASKTCTDEGKQAIKALSFDDQNGVNLAVTSGRAAAGLSDTEVAEYQTKVTNGALRFAGEYASPVLYGIAVPRPAGVAAGSGPMAKPIADAINKLISTGAYQAILKKWGIESGGLTSATINGATS
jgi:polar amino acid transport system substrate-binding protein